MDKPNYPEIAAQMRAIELPEELKLLISAYCHESVRAEEVAREICIYGKFETSYVGRQKLLDNVCTYIEIHVELTGNDPQKLIDNLMLQIAERPVEKFSIRDLSQEQRKRLMQLIAEKTPEL